MLQFFGNNDRADEIPHTFSRISQLLEHVDIQGHQTVSGV